ncbi:hypothetical protein FXO38_21760 [Capsicum annuum]|nr:hypothetical protein FXO38_21760 [Capsicum annuum]
MRSVWSQSSGICSYFWQQGSKQTFPTFLIRRRVLMIEGGIMNDELDLNCCKSSILSSSLSQIRKSECYVAVPWLCKSDEELIFPNHLSFRSPEVQELYICNCLEERIGVKVDFRISFYLGKFPKGGWSIIPAGDTSQFIPSRDADIAFLEEPEHLNWYHPDLSAKHKIDLDEDTHEVQSAAKGLNLDVNVMKGRDDTDDSLHGDARCTAVAELLQ